jgi:hypothetical protein
MRKVKIISKVFGVMVAVLIIGYLIFANTVPFDVTRHYISNGKNILLLTPSNRVRTTNGISKQTDDTIYFNSKMQFLYDTAKVKIHFKNPSNSQQVLLGYSDQNIWHYNTQVLDDPLLDNLNWSKIGKGPFLYQKQPTYKSVDDFIKNPPQNKIVGLADYKDTKLVQSNIRLPDYKPAKNPTSIDVPLRGKVTMYAYLDNEPFDMTITKRDLNWRSDPDTVKVSIFKDQDNVYNAAIDDDGNSSNNHQPGLPQSTTIKNPGPGLPEPGVYKIIIDTTTDSLITNITTNLHKIVFEGPLYLADNQTVYPSIVPKSRPSVLTTNAQSINFRSDHGQSNIVKVGQQSINIKSPGQIITASSPLPMTLVTVPNSDMVVNSSGYFSFSPEHFFSPSTYKILPIANADDLTQVDFVLTNYLGAPKKEGDWMVAEREFNIKDAVTEKRQLSWMINAPGLSANNNSVMYKQIQMTLTKKGWIK